jgi:hypothetical protein
MMMASFAYQEILRGREESEKVESILNPFYSERISGTIEPTFGIKWGC